MRIGTKFVLAATVLVFLFTSAQARGKLTTKYKYYTVSGSSAAALHRNMTVPTGFFSSEKVYANITMKPSFSGKFVPGKKRCKIRGFGINGQFLIRLPKLRSGTRLSKNLNRKFRNFVSYVRKHELKHRSIWTSCLRNAESRIQRLRVKNCNRLDQQAAKIITSEWAKCARRNTRFDALEQKRLRRLPLVRDAFRRVKPSKRAVRKRTTKSSNRRKSTFGRANNFN